MPPLYFFGWPSPVGGADTKLEHLLPLLAGESDIVVVPNSPERLDDAEKRAWLEAHGVRSVLREALPQRLEGWAVALCNQDFFAKGIAWDMRRRGLRVAWSSEMMWHFQAELGAVLFGWVDAVLYVSPVQRAALEPGYHHALSGGREPLASAPLADPEAGWGEIHCPANGRKLRWVMTGNYIDPAKFPFRQRGVDGSRVFTIGRLSRPDPGKFPDDFPESYERLGVRDPCRFRVMAWSEQLAARWSAHRFDRRWELLGAAQERAADFLNSLDVLVYDVGSGLRESWGRAVVEAMLSGVVPLVPKGNGHHLSNLFPDGVGGFHCTGLEDYARRVRSLQDDPALLRRMSRTAREWAETKLCRAEDHRALWRRVFTPS